jgi:hypothetical protein
MDRPTHRPTRRLLAGAVATVSLLSVPAASQAAVTFGSRLNNNPANSGNECMPFGGACELVSFIHPIDPDGDPYSGGAPMEGVITKFRIRGFGSNGPTNVTFRLADISRPDPNNNSIAVATDAGTGPTGALPGPPPGDTPISEFAAQLPVKMGNHLAIQGTDVAAVHNSSGDKFTYIFFPPLVAGQAPQQSNDSVPELLVAAVIEPDADGDGFGDETQDQCPRQKTTQGPCDDTKPDLSKLKLAPAAFRALSSGDSIAAKRRQAKRKRATRGSKVSYDLSEVAAVNFTIERVVKGRRKGKKCVSKRKRGRRCTKRTVVGSFAQDGKAGANSFKFSGRINGKALRRGSYRLSATPTDLPGNVGSPARKNFRIVR